MVSLGFGGVSIPPIARDRVMLRKPTLLSYGWPAAILVSLWSSILSTAKSEPRVGSATSYESDESSLEKVCQYPGVSWARFAAIGTRTTPKMMRITVSRSADDVNMAGCWQDGSNDAPASKGWVEKTLC